MAARLSFHGAAGSVTGSCFLLQTERARILIDCGMFQGSKTEKELNYRDFPFRPSDIDAVLLSHAHIDHSGLIPKLVKAGYRGSIFATRATVDLCSVMLPDSGHIQEAEVEQLNRRNVRRGKGAVRPIYTAADARACLDRFSPVEYRAWTSVARDVRARFWNAGHLLGSASIELELKDGGGAPMRLLFSGDIGPSAKLLHIDPEGPSDVDFVVCESTYGDVDRQETSNEHRRAMLRDEVRAAANPAGALLIPSFAVERTQELLVDLVTLMESGAIPEAPIIIDSPLATRASAIFGRHAAEIEDGAALARALHSRHVRFTESVEESKALDAHKGFHIVIAASGMCEAGRIRHRLKNWLWRAEATVLIVGYQAEGTLGRILLNGAPAVRIQGDEIEVRARIRSLDLYSGHADGPELAAWIKARLPIRQGLFLVHGEEDARSGLRALLGAFTDATRVVAPKLDDAFELTAAGPRHVASAEPPRLAPVHVGHLDWHNDLSRLVLDINDTVRNAADERARGVVIRRIRRALAEAVEPG